MASSTCNYLDTIELLSPENILASNNISIPGLNPNVIKIPCDNTVQATDKLKISISMQKSCTVSMEIRHISSLATTFLSYRVLEDDFFAICGEREVVVLDESINIIQTYVEPNDAEEFHCVCWGLRKNKILLAVGGNLGFLYILNVLNKGCYRILKGHVKRINYAIFLPSDCSLLLSASDDLTIRLWNIKNSVQISTFENHVHGILTLDWHHSQKVFLSAGKDSCIKFWTIFPVLNELEFSKDWNGSNFPTKKIRKPSFSNSKLHASYIDCATFYGDLIISKGQEGKIIVWKSENQKFDSIVVLFVLEYPIFGEINMRFSINPKTKLLFIGGLEGEVYCYHLNYSSEFILSTSRSAGIIRTVLASNHHLITADHLGNITIHSIE